MWSPRYRMRKQRNHNPQAKVEHPKVNRHSPMHQGKVADQVRRLIYEERAYRDR